MFSVALTFSDEIPEIAALDYEMPHCIDFGGEIYVRQEGKGMLLGTYERACVPWSPDTTPWDFGHELLEPDMERVAESLEVGFEHFPPLADAGIKRWVNGPFTFSPDGNPLVAGQTIDDEWAAWGVQVSAAATAPGTAA